MKRAIKVAAITILLRGEEFFRRLSAQEKKILQPFEIGQRSALRKGKEAYSATITVLPKSTRAHAKLDPRLLQTISRCFPFYDNPASQKKFQSVFQNPSSFYHTTLTAYPNIFWKILQEKGNENKIILSRFSVLLFSQQSHCCHIVIKEGHPPYPLFYLNVLKLIVKAIMTHERNGIMLHASCIEENGYGYVFIGRSRAGKSTVVQLLNPKGVLSDETAIIKRRGSSYVLFPNPWWNLHNYTIIPNPQRAVPLKAIFFIAKDHSTQMKGLSAKEAISLLFCLDGYCQQVGFKDNKSGIKSFYVFAQKLFTKTPTFLLYIRKSRHFRNEFAGLLKRIAE